MRAVDVLIFIEHAARELDTACAVAHLAARDHGLRIAIEPLTWRLDQTLAAYEPAIVAVPYCYSAQPEDPGHDEMLRRWPDAAYVNLGYEQVFQRINEDFKVPRDAFARDHVLHHAWGTFAVERLRRHGVPAAHIRLNGNPSYALYRPPYRDGFVSRETLAQRHRLNPAKRWAFIPENYGAAFHTTGALRDHVRRGWPAAQARQYRAFAQASLAEAVQWWQEAAQDSRWEVIVRPRPFTPLAAFARACRRSLGRTPPRFHLLKDGSVREWVLASDLVLSSYSTTLIEAAVAGKPVAMFAPRPLPPFLEAPWYRHVPQLASVEAFLAAFEDGLPAQAGEALRAWAEDLMLSQGDPIANLAGWFASIRRSACIVPPPLPPSAAAGGARRLSWRGAVRPWRRAWRRLTQTRLHEDDQLEPAAVAARGAHWAQVLASGRSAPEQLLTASS